MSEYKLDKLYYFAHPYSVKNLFGDYILFAEDANFRICNVRAAQLIERGYLIYSPISQNHPIHMASPAFLKDEVHEMWYKFDAAFIKQANFAGIILAPGWEDSKGCCAERKLFEERGLELLYYKDIVE